MTYDEADSSLVLSSGRREFCTSATLGICEDGEWVVYGSDGGIHAQDWTHAERIELADEMIRRWQVFKAADAPR